MRCGACGATDNLVPRSSAHHRVVLVLCGPCCERVDLAVRSALERQLAEAEAEAERLEQLGKDWAWMENRRHVDRVRSRRFRARRRQPPG